jgi:hypothetical protein
MVLGLAAIFLLNAVVPAGPGQFGFGHNAFVGMQYGFVVLVFKV